MSDIPEQRWASVPAEVIPLRRELVAWLKGDAALVRGFVERQGSDVVRAWIRERTALYAGKYPAEREARLWHESALDLVCWQRRVAEPGKMLRWIRQWEESVKEAQS